MSNKVPRQFELKTPTLCEIEQIKKLLNDHGISTLNENMIVKEMNYNAPGTGFKQVVLTNEIVIHMKIIKKIKYIKYCRPNLV